MTAIETHGLTKRYGDVVALDGLDLTVRDGEVFGFLGPNGAGKSTAINVLLGFLTPTDGTARVLGHDVRSESRAIRQRVGLLPERHATYERLTAREHLTYAIEAKGAADDPDALLDRTGLAPEARDRRAGNYSTGMRQRLALALSLVGDPELLILDEPSAGLDPEGIRAMLATVREIAESGTAVFFSSHVLPAVEAVCDRVGILRNGRLAAVDTVEGLRRTADASATVTVDADAVPDVNLTSLPGVESVAVEGTRLRITCSSPTAKAPAIARLAEATTVRDVRIDDASLDDLFAEITQSAASIDPEGVASERPGVAE